jgi:hypothetical protein
MEYFQTDNPAIAVALAMCDVPVPQTPDGPFPMLMLYTLDNLRALGYGGMGAREAGHKARKDRKSGTRVWQFVPDDTFHEIMAGWKEAEALHSKKQSLVLPKHDAKDLGRWAFYFNSQRTLFLTTHDVPTYIAFMGNTATQRKNVLLNGKKTDAVEVATTRGSFSCVSIDAPESVWREIKP